MKKRLSDITTKIITGRSILDKIKKNHYEDIGSIPTQIKNVEVVRIWREVVGGSNFLLEESFFRQGGNSLKAIQLISEIYKTYGFQLTFEDFFENDTLLKLDNLITVLSIDSKKRAIEISPLPNENIYPASKSQIRLWINCQHQELNRSYNVQSIYRLKGQINVAALISSFEILFKYYEVLRTVFKYEDDNLFQVILPFNKSEHSLKVIAFEQIDNPLESALEDLKEEFDLKEGPLCIVKCYCLKSDEVLLTFTAHHIVVDGWSLELIFGKILELYKKYPHLNDIKKPKFQYRDLSAWDDSNKVNYEKEKNYWQNKFLVNSAPLLLKNINRRFEPGIHKGTRIILDIPDHTNKKLRSLASSHDTSLYVTLVTAVNILLYRYSGQKDFTIGIPVTGRNTEFHYDQIGCFLNMMLFRSMINEEDTFKDLLISNKQQLTSDLSNQNYGFDELQRFIRGKQMSVNESVFEIIISMQNFDQVLSNNKDLFDFAVERIEPEFCICKCPLEIFFREKDDILQIGFEYSNSHYTKIFIDNLINRFLLILDITATNINIKASEILPSEFENTNNFANNDFDFSFD